MTSRVIFDLEQKIDEPVSTFLWDIPPNIAPDACARIIVETCKYLLFARQIIPSPFDQFRRSIENQRQRQEQEDAERRSNPLLRRKLKSRNDVKREMLATKLLQLVDHFDALAQLVEDLDVHAVCLVVGSGSLNLVKELYWIALPYGYSRDYGSATDDSSQRRCREHCDVETASRLTRQALRELAIGAQGLCGHSNHSSRLLKFTFLVALRNDKCHYSVSSLAEAAALLANARSGGQFAPMITPKFTLSVKPPVFLILPTAAKTGVKSTADESDDNPFGLNDFAACNVEEEDSSLSTPSYPNNYISLMSTHHATALRAEAVYTQLEPLKSSLVVPFTTSPPGIPRGNSVPILLSRGVSLMNGDFEAKPTRQLAKPKSSASRHNMVTSDTPSHGRGGLLAWTRARQRTIHNQSIRLSADSDCQLDVCMSSKRMSEAGNSPAGPEASVTSHVDDEDYDSSESLLPRLGGVRTGSPTESLECSKRVRMDCKPDSIEGDVADELEELTITPRTRGNDTKPAATQTSAPFTLSWAKSRVWFPAFV